MPEVKERFAAGGGVPGGMRPEAFGDAIRKEAASLKKVAADGERQTGMKSLAR